MVYAFLSECAEQERRGQPPGTIAPISDRALAEKLSCSKKTLQVVQQALVDAGHLEMRDDGSRFCALYAEMQKEAKREADRRRQQQVRSGKNGAENGIENGAEACKCHTAVTPKPAQNGHDVTVAVTNSSRACAGADGVVSKAEDDDADGDADVRSHTGDSSSSSSSASSSASATSRARIREALPSLEANARADGVPEAVITEASRRLLAAADDGPIARPSGYYLSILRTVRKEVEQERLTLLSTVPGGASAAPLPRARNGTGPLTAEQMVERNRRLLEGSSGRIF